MFQFLAGLLGARKKNRKGLRRPPARRPYERSMGRRGR
jgi:hypothetical protein